jgi:flagellar motor protein MotB
MWQHRREDADNPAWPGLVDIFIFTLALLLIIWFANNFPQKVENLEKESRNLHENVALLAREKQQLQDQDQSLKDRLTRVDQANTMLNDKIKVMEGAVQNLDVQRARLQENNVGLGAELQRLNAENAFLRDIGHQDWEELLKLLQSRLAGMNLVIVPNEREKEIEIHGRPGITFETSQYELSGTERLRLERLAPILADLRQQKPFFVTISGTADPRELNNLAPPRNNAELSALRAATVAALLENASPGLGRYLRVMGLGVKGQGRALAPGEDPDLIYQEYRAVNLIVKIDVAALMQNGSNHQMTSKSPG